MEDRQVREMMREREEGQRQTHLGTRAGDKCRAGGVEMRGHKERLKERRERQGKSEKERAQ